MAASPVENHMLIRFEPIGELCGTQELDWSLTGAAQPCQELRDGA